MQRRFAAGELQDFDLAFARDHPLNAGLDVG
jgi:hypothetical protein